MSKGARISQTELSRHVNSSTLPSSSEHENAGFTLIEALVALTILAISLAAIGQLTFSSLRSSLHVERHMAAIETARKLVAQLPSHDELGEGLHTGALEGYRWRVEAAPFPNDLAPAAVASGWEPRLVVLRVIGPFGDEVEIDMVRLRKRAGR